MNNEMFSVFFVLFSPYFSSKTQCNRRLRRTKNSSRLSILYFASVKLKQAYSKAASKLSSKYMLERSFILS